MSDIDLDKLKAGMCKDNTGCNGLTYCACDALDTLITELEQLRNKVAAQERLNKTLSETVRILNKKLNDTQLLADAGWSQSVIDSERQANALLTADVERLRAEVEKYKQDGMKWRDSFLKECFRAEKAEALLRDLVNDSEAIHREGCDCPLCSAFDHLEALAQKEPEPKRECGTCLHAPKPTDREADLCSRPCLDCVHLKFEKPHLQDHWQPKEGA